MLGAIATSFAFCFVLLVLFLYVRYLLLQRRRRQLTAAHPESEPKVGLDPQLIAQLPAFPYRRTSIDTSTDIDAGSVECSICLSVLEEGENVRLIPNCNHLFHQECIDVWLSTNASCPVCRGDPEPRFSEHGGFSSKGRLSSGELEGVVWTRSEWLRVHGRDANMDLERQ
ncbi:hypothetical protein LUZ60_009702 [Juncus effusus]|nr:hypothetical protein LUZ60_009702 [Juncus effusus]